MCIEIISLKVEWRWQFTLFIKFFSTEHLLTLFLNNIAIFRIDEVTFLVYSTAYFVN